MNPALENTRLAYERTALAWVRTALSFIGFGFTISKFFDTLQSQSGARQHLLSPRAIGVTMISMGLLALLLAVLQLWQGMNELRKQYPRAPRSVAVIQAALVAVLGILAMIGSFLR